MFAMSTAWNSYRHRNVRLMLEEILELGIDRVELDFNLKKRSVTDISGLASGGMIKVVSVHNFCPVPENIKTKKVSPDHYSMASTDETERKKSVQHTRQTIETAHSLGASAVVVHAGRLNISDETRKLAKVIGNVKEAQRMLAAMRIKRKAELEKGHLEALLKSIGELSRLAKQYDVKIGLENRFYFREMPSVEEFETIFERYGRDSNIGYWHDTGHARVFENLGITRPMEYLDRFADRLIGMHLHDIKNVLDDHQAPLSGYIDFGAFRPYMKKDTLKVLEPHYQATAPEIKKGLEHLKKVFAEG